MIKCCVQCNRGYARAARRESFVVVYMRDILVCMTWQLESIVPRIACIIGHVLVITII